MRKDGGEIGPLDNFCDTLKPVLIIPLSECEGRGWHGLAMNDAGDPHLFLPEPAEKRIFRRLSQDSEHAQDSRCSNGVRRCQ